jgi:undecaprenyl-diphosphatase
MSLYRNPFLDQFFILLTWAGSLYVLLPLAMMLGVFLLFRGRSGDAWLLGAGFGGAVLMAHVLKRIIGRPRPDLAPALVPMPLDLSFPSAHTTQITAFCVCLLIIACRGPNLVPCWAAALTGVFLVGVVGYSRVYLQVHYPSDVVAGFLLALVWVAGLKVLLNRLNI